MGNFELTLEPSAGKIRLMPEHGIIWISCNGLVTPYKIMPSEESYTSAIAANNAGVFWNGERIGSIYAVSYGLDGWLQAAFSHDGAPELYENEATIFALPKFATTSVECPFCQNIYKSGWDACPCIYESPVIILKKIVIDSVRFLDGRHDNISELDMRREVLDRYFANTMQNLQIVEPL